MSPKYIKFYDTDFIEQDGFVIETNGNLSYVENIETGEAEWLAPHEMENPYDYSR